ncbi:MAG: hypothetical protein JW769_02575 [Parachlamydiales bacterium]|nr:hypothetical protein [Parachlamydiales bacterium]
MTNSIDFTALPQGKYTLEHISNNQTIEISSRHSSLIQRVNDLCLFLFVTICSLGLIHLFDAGRQYTSRLLSDIISGQKKITCVKSNSVPWDTLEMVKDLYSIHQEKISVSFPQEIVRQNEELWNQMLGKPSTPPVSPRVEGWEEQLLELQKETNETNQEQSVEAPEQTEVVRYGWEERVQPLEMIQAADRMNQRLAGHPNGCSHYCVRFLEKEENFDFTSSSLKRMLEQEGDGIPAVEGLNPAPGDVIETSSILEEDLNCPDLLSLLSEETTVLEKLKKHIKEIISLSTISGFTITTGLETLAVRFRPSDKIELFDPHGDPAQEKPAYICVLPHNAESADKIAEMIHERDSFVFDFSFCLCKRR